MSPASHFVCFCLCLSTVLVLASASPAKAIWQDDDNWGKWIGHMHNDAARRCNLIPPARITNWMESPKCKNSLQSYFYNRFSGRCENHGGCQSPRNFATKQECELACRGEFHREEATSTPVAKLAKTTTPATTSKGTTTVASNKSNRKMSIPSACTFPAVKGSCRGHFRMYYYDQHLGRCSDFIYGGCDGNQNRFRSLTECQHICMAPHKEGSSLANDDHGIHHNHGDDDEEEN